MVHRCSTSRSRLISTVKCTHDSIVHATLTVLPIKDFQHSINNVGWLDAVGNDLARESADESNKRDSFIDWPELIVERTSRAERVIKASGRMDVYVWARMRWRMSLSFSFTASARVRGSQEHRVFRGHTHAHLNTFGKVIRASPRGVLGLDTRVKRSCCSGSWVDSSFLNETETETETETKTERHTHATGHAGCLGSVLRICSCSRGQ